MTLGNGHFFLRTRLEVPLAGSGFAALALSLTLAASPGGTAASPRFALPIDCVPGTTCFVQNYVDHDPSSAWRDYACGARSYDGHDGTDFRVPSMAAVRAGVAVLAAADGVVAGVRDGMPDVSIRETGKEAVKNRECGNGLVLRHADGWETQYCHLAQGSVAVRRGQVVRAGERLGLVGLSGLTEFPHLHLTVRHHGKAIDPFAPAPVAGACGSEQTLWDAAAAQALVYRRRVLLNHGFSDRALTMAEVENLAAGEPLPTSQSAALVAWVRMIGLEPGDTAQLTLHGPDGTVIAERRQPALERAQAQSLSLIGRKRPAPGWPAGTYRAQYQITNAGQTVFSQTFSLRIAADAPVN